MYIYIYLSLDLVFFILHFIRSLFFHILFNIVLFFTFFVLLISFRLYFHSIFENYVRYLIVISVCIKGTDEEEEGNETFINADERSDFPPGGGANIFLNDNGNRYTSGITLSLLGTNNN